VPIESALLPPSSRYGYPKEQTDKSARKSLWNSPAKRDENGFIIPARRVLEFVGEGYIRVAVYADDEASLSASAVGLFSAAPVAAGDTVDLGTLTVIDGVSTPLGDAAPFEYIKSAAGDDVLSVAARGVSEAIETQCRAEYERALGMCGAVAYPMGLSRGMALCRETRSIDTNNVGATNGFESSKTVHHHKFLSGRCAAFGLSGRA
jgi:hypothetical protein